MLIFRTLPCKYITTTILQATYYTLCTLRGLASDALISHTGIIVICPIAIAYSMGQIIKLNKQNCTQFH